MSHTIRVFGLTTALLATAASAYTKPTHVEMTRRAVERSQLNNRIWELGGTMGLSTVNDSMTNGSKWFFGFTLFEDRKSVVDWISEGVWNEDAIQDVDGNVLRMLNHFYNPLAPPGAEGYSWEGVLTGEPSLRWALEPEWEIKQRYSYRDAKKYIEGSVLAPTEQQRKSHLSHLFLTVGHLIHLVQDLGQPQHTRNDSHGPTSLSAYEAFTDEVRGQLPYEGYDVVHFDAFEKFWVTDNGSGLANYSNRGFVTAGTNFQGHRAGDTLVIRPDPGFPSPSGAGAPVDHKQITDPDLLGPNGPGQPVIGEMWFVRTPVADHLRGTIDENPRTSTFSIFDEDLEYDFSWSFALNEFNFRSAQRLLIPRAVAYSAGLIDYIFRGKITIGPPPTGPYAVVDHATTTGFQTLKATVTNDTPGEALSQGTLVLVARYHRNECYRPDLSGEIIHGGGGMEGFPCPDYRSEEEFISVSEEQSISLGIGSQATLTFNFPTPIPMNATDLHLQVLYRRKVGLEEDGIAVGMKDIAEPTFFAPMNATDLYPLSTSTGDRFFYYLDIIANITQTDPPFSSVDTNGNGEYDDGDTPIRGETMSFEVRFDGALIATAPALPEGRFSRLAMLVEPGPKRLRVRSTGGGFDQTDYFDFYAKIGQLDYQINGYWYTPTYRLRQLTFQPMAGVYYRTWLRPDIFSMPISLAGGALTPLPLEISPLP